MEGLPIEILLALVVVAGLAGMLTTIISSLNERRREMAVLRAIGAHPYQIVLLFVLETLLIIVSAIILGIMLLYAILLVFKPLILAWVGINIQITMLDWQQWLVLGCLIGLLSVEWIVRKSVNMP